MDALLSLLITDCIAPTSAESFAHTYGFSRGAASITITNSNHYDMTITLGSWTTIVPYDTPASWTTLSVTTLPANTSASYNFTIGGSTGSGPVIIDDTLTSNINWACGGESGNITASAVLSHRETGA